MNKDDLIDAVRKIATVIIYQNNCASDLLNAIFKNIHKPPKKIDALPTPGL